MAAEDRFYSRAIALCDEAMLALNNAVEEGTIRHLDRCSLSVESELSIKGPKLLLKCPFNVV